MHEGHRARLTAKVKSGQLYEHEILEVLLFNSCPRRDLNATAHNLIARFESIEGVLAAPFEELIKVDGVGENIAKYIVVLGKALSRCGDCTSFATIGCTADFKKYIAARGGMDHDIFEACLLDRDGSLIRIWRQESEHGRIELATDSLIKSTSVHSTYGLFAVYYRADNDKSLEADDKMLKSISEVCRLCGTRFYDYCIVYPDGEIFSYFVSGREEIYILRN